MSVLVRVFVIFLMINIGLSLSGFSISNSNSDIMNASYSGSSISDVSGLAGLLSIIGPLISFITGDGIMGLLSSAGMPVSLQLLIGLPFSIMSLYLLATVISGALGFVLR